MEGVPSGAASLHAAHCDSYVQSSLGPGHDVAGDDSTCNAARTSARIIHAAISKSSVLRDVVPNRSRGAVQRQIVEPRATPRLRKRVGRRQEKTTVRGDALGRIQRGIHRAFDEEDANRPRGCELSVRVGPARRLRRRSPPTSAQTSRVPRATSIPQQIEILLGDEPVFVRVPQHVHGIALEFVVRARVTRGDADEWDGELAAGVVVVEDGAREGGDVHPGVGFTGDENRLARGRGTCRGRNRRGRRGRRRRWSCRCCGTRPAELRLAVGVADAGRALEREDVRLEGPRPRVGHESAGAIDEERAHLLEPAEDAGRAGAAVEPEDHGARGVIVAAGLREPVVQLRAGSAAEASRKPE